MKKTGLFFILLIMSQLTFAQGQKITWLTIEEAATRAKTENKKVLIDIYTDWCGWCKRMDKDTYENQVIIKYINTHYLPVKFNAEQKETVNLGQNQFKYVTQGSRSYHELAVALTAGKLSYPTTVFLNEKFEILQSLPGYHNAQTFDPVIHFFVEAAEKGISWEDYQKIYQSSPKE